MTSTPYMSRVVTTYCTSCWIPAVVHAVSFIGGYLAVIYLYKTCKGISGEILWSIAIVLIPWIVVSWLIMPLSVIINLYNKRWLKACIAIILCGLATIPLALLVIMSRLMASWH